jgi:hypothetical protein
VLAIVLAIPRWRDDRRLRAVLLWAGAVIVPLCFGGQRQFHYLFPAMPALAVLSAWLIDRMIDRDVRHWQLARSLLICTAGVGVPIALALPIVGRSMRGLVLPVDWFVMTLLLLGVLASLALLLRRPPEQGAFAFAIAAAVGMTVITQAWMPTLRRNSPREIAAEIRAVDPSGPYCFYGEKMSLPLVFYMKQIVPQYETPAELQEALDATPRLIVIAQTKSGVSPPPAPAGLERAAEIKSEDQTFEVYRVRAR